MALIDSKEQARDNLMHALMNAFYASDLSEEMRELMHKEVNRIEKLFGYEKNSWRA